MSIQEEIERLLSRSWSSKAELYGAVRHVVGADVHFDCFEEWKPGTVLIRHNPIGNPAHAFEYTVTLAARAKAA